MLDMDYASSLLNAPLRDEDLEMHSPETYKRYVEKHWRTRTI